MQLGKFLLVTAAALLSICSVAEAGHKKRSRGWRKLVHNKCANEGEVAVAVGGPIDKRMIRTVKRAIRKGHTDITLVINGRDLSKPGNRKNKRRNVSFVKDVAKTVTFAVLPWDTRRRLKSMKMSRLRKLYRKSAKAIEKVIGTRPLVAHMSPSLLNKKRVKYMHRSGFIVLGNTTQFEKPKKDLARKTFIALQHPRVHQFSKLLRDANKAMFKVVSLSKCLDKPIFKGGLEEVNNEAEEEGGDENDEI